MQCLQCGTQIPDGMPTCPNCGAPLNNQPAGGGQPYGFSQKLTKKEFLHHPNLKKIRSNINSSAIILYVAAVLTSVLGLVDGNYFILIDIALLVGLGLGIHLAQSRVCAIIACVYSAFNVIITVVTTGSVGGWLVLVAAIYAIIATFQFQKAWKEYQQTGILPAAK